MTGGQRVAKVSEIKTGFLQCIANLGCSHFFRMHTSQKRTNRVSQAWSSRVNRRKQLSYTLRLIRRKADKGSENFHCFSQSGDFRVENIALLNSAFQIYNRLIEGVNVFLRSCHA